MRRIGTGTRTGSYFRKVRQQTRDYVEGLIHENERLRRLEASCASGHTRLPEETDQTRQELSRSESQTRSLHGQPCEKCDENQALAREYFELEQQNTNLARLYVASSRLQGTLDRNKVLEAIEDIVVNLIGSEELAILENTPDGSALELVASCGIDPSRLRSVPLGRGQIGRAAQTGQILLAEAGELRSLPEEKGLTACIPLTLDEHPIGVIAIFRLLPQREGFDEFDEELFEFLAKQAGTALYCTALHARQAA